MTNTYYFNQKGNAVIQKTLEFLGILRAILQKNTFLFINLF